MNEDKRIENKKSDKKALIIFIPCMLVSFVVGFFLSAMGNFMEENLADVIANGLNVFLEIVSPYANLAMNTLVIIICSIVLVNVKRRIKAWDGDDEEVYEKIEKNISVVLILSNLVFILSFFFFGAGFDYCLHNTKTTTVELICYFAGFVIALIGNLMMNAGTVNLYKEMNPEKQGSVYAMDFGKQWEKSCDEAEKMQIYKAAFKSYSFCNTFYVFLWLFCLLGNEIWHYGIMPATIVIVVWLAQFISCQAYAAYYSKNPNKV